SAGTVDARGRQTADAVGRTHREGETSVLPGPAFDVFRRLHLPLCPFAVRRGLAARRWSGRYGDRRPPQYRARRRSARDQFAALYASYAESRALRKRKRREDR